MATSRAFVTPIASWSNLVYVGLLFLGSVGFMAFGSFVIGPTIGNLFSGYYNGLIQSSTGPGVMPSPWIFTAFTMAEIGLYLLIYSGAFAAVLWIGRRWGLVQASGSLRLATLLVFGFGVLLTVTDSQFTGRIHVANVEMAMYYDGLLLAAFGLAWVGAAAAAGVRGARPRLNASRGPRTRRRT